MRGVEALLVRLNHVVLLFSRPRPPALGQIMLYVDGMNGVIRHAETRQWLYTLVGSKVELGAVRKSSKKTPQKLTKKAGQPLFS